MLHLNFVPYSIVIDQKLTRHCPNEKWFRYFKKSLLLGRSPFGLLYIHQNVTPNKRGFEKSFFRALMVMASCRESLFYTQEKLTLTYLSKTKATYQVSVGLVLKASEHLKVKKPAVNKQEVLTFFKIRRCFVLKRELNLYLRVHRACCHWLLHFKAYINILVCSYKASQYIQIKFKSWMSWISWLNYAVQLSRGFSFM